ncbi:hypothetical protein GCM10010358_81690 [Streptomyces minutiscleroticus]|uniref:Uncharacterized protein n=1 Tax=Streptomyces minutiscleroticus TaxID=68238 RepID=A0A918P3R6_9ACTN|nr:hypothetical protein [Streptomyces minutiscleroticus]GGY18025.1 hypothetical protein GCM10010358_81690 [Streptomyces minutiscleroticus]
MPTTLPLPLKFRLPRGWLPARPDGFATADVAFAAVHPHPDAGFAATLTIDGEALPSEATLADVAEESTQRLHEIAESVAVTHRHEVGSVEAPALTQRLAFPPSSTARAATSSSPRCISA